MDSPPPYYAGQKKSNVGLIVAIILGVVCVCCILPLIGFGGLAWWGFGKVKGMVGCSITLTNLESAVQDYADAHDGKLPNAKTWQTDIRSYYESEVKKHAKEQQMFTGGSQEVGCTNDNAAPTGIAFNTELSGKKQSDIKDPNSTVMLFEVSKTGSNLNEPYKPQPFDSSPFMLGSKRGWYICVASGRVQLVGRRGLRTDVNVNTGPGQP